MKCVCNKSSELSYEDVNKLYEMFKDNMAKFAEKLNLYKCIYVDSYKEKWINDTLKDENLLCFRYYYEEDLAGFIFIIVNEDENFVREFHVDKKFQGDGKTFYQMIKLAVSDISNENDYTGDIWMINDKSKAVFKHIGAKFDDKKYRISSNHLKEWLNR